MDGVIWLMSSRTRIDPFLLLSFLTHPWSGSQDAYILALPLPPLMGHQESPLSESRFPHLTNAWPTLGLLHTWHLTIQYIIIALNVLIKGLGVLIFFFFFIKGIRSGIQACSQWTFRPRYEKQSPESQGLPRGRILRVHNSFCLKKTKVLWRPSPPVKSVTFNFLSLPNSSQNFRQIKAGTFDLLPRCFDHRRATYVHTFLDIFRFLQALKF